MNLAFAYEWRRITTLRSTWWMSGLALAITMAFTFFASMTIVLGGGDIEGSLTQDESNWFLDAAMTQFSHIDPSFYLLAFIVAVIGILSWGHEYRHGMIRATLTAVPQRWMVWVAKYALVGAWVAILVVISCVGSLLIALVWFANVDLDFDAGYLLLAIFKRVVYTVLVTWLVMSICVLIRHQTFALVFLYLWPLGIENMVRAMLGIVGAIRGDDTPLAVGRFMPFNAGGRIIQTWSPADAANDTGLVLQDNLDLFGDPMSAWGGFIIFGGFTFALMAASLVVFQRRDA